MKNTKIKKYRTCEEAFDSIGKKYSEDFWACYNEDIGDRELCPFAKTDTCPSKEFPY